jgi:hypothetical protein
MIRTFLILLRINSNFSGFTWWPPPPGAKMKDTKTSSSNSIESKIVLWVWMYIKK